MGGGARPGGGPPKRPRVSGDSAGGAAAGAAGRAQGAAGRAAGGLLGKVPVVGRPLQAAAKGLGKLGKAGGAAAAGAKQAASGDPEGAGSSVASAAGRKVAGGAKRVGKAAARTAGKAAKQAGKLAARGARNLLAKLVAMGPPGWIIIAVVALLGVVIGIAMWMSVTQFAGSFSVTGSDQQQVSGGGGAGTGSTYSSDQLFMRTQADRDDVTDAMPGVFGADSSRSSARASAAAAFPAGAVRVAANGGLSGVVPGRLVMAEVIPDSQRGLAALVEWMLPQWVAPYPVMIAAAEDVELVDGQWPDSDGNDEEARLVTCGWPEGEWTADPDPGPSLPSVDRGDVRIEGPWGHEQQHVCHLLAAAQTVWDAWEATFGDDGFWVGSDGVRVLDLAAARTAWLGEPVEGEPVEGPVATMTAAQQADLASFAGSVSGAQDRLWGWLSFAGMVGAEDAPVSAQYDCAIGNGPLEFEWKFMGDYAESGGTEMPDDGLSPPEDFFAEVEDGHLMVPWPCPKPVLAAGAAGAQGMWSPVPWAQYLGDFGPGGSRLVDGLGVSAAALATMRDYGFAVGRATDHGARPKRAHGEYEDMKSELPEPFDLGWLSTPQEWSYHADPSHEGVIAWCQPDTRWVSESAEPMIKVNAEPEDHPKEDLMAAFAADLVNINKLHGEATKLLADAQRIYRKIADDLAARRKAIIDEALDGAGVGQTDAGTADVLIREALAAKQAELAALQEKLNHAAEMVAAMHDVVDYWDHAKEQATLRPTILPGPTWQYECEHESYRDALGSLEDDWHGDSLPDNASPLRALYTVGGRGRALAVLGDHVGSNTPFEGTLRLAYLVGLLPDPADGYDPDTQTRRPMVSASCSLDRWLDRDCRMDRARTAGGETTVMPKSWTDPRIDVGCPPVYEQASNLRDGQLGQAAARWHHARDAGMVSLDPIFDFHPCLLPEIEALVWLAEQTGLPLRVTPGGNGYRTYKQSDELAEKSSLAVPGGSSRHNFGLALDFEWQPPWCWPPPDRHDQECDPDSEGPSDDWKLCGREAYGAGKARGPTPPSAGFTTPANTGQTTGRMPGGYPSEPDEIVMVNWCWRFLDLVTYGLSGLDERLKLRDLVEGDRYPIVALMPLAHEMWHWSYDGR